MSRRFISRAGRAPALFLALTLGACMPAAPPAPAVPPAAAEPEEQARKLAFEPITGLPDERATTFATALGQSAAEQELNVVSRESDEVDLRLKGYITATSEGRETVVAYVWDIFDTEGERVHRIEGEERLPATLPDPWQAVTDDALQAVARRTVGSLQAWLGSGAPVTTAAAIMREARLAG